MLKFAKRKFGAGKGEKYFWLLQSYTFFPTNQWYSTEGVPDQGVAYMSIAGDWDKTPPCLQLVQVVPISESEVSLAIGPKSFFLFGGSRRILCWIPDEVSGEMHDS
jgi:hypothetical protein